jgi:hypothetical protein
MDERTGRVLQAIWGAQRGYVFLPQKQSGRWLETSAYEWPDKFARVLSYNNTQVDQYFCPLVFSEPERRAEHALPTHVLWSDLDGADPRKIRLRPSIAWRTTQGGLPPITVGQAAHLQATGVDLREKYPERYPPTKPRYQAIWLLQYERGQFSVDSPAITKPILQQVEAHVAADLSRRIAYAEAPLGADRSGWDVTQVLRLPGSLNHKHTPPHRVELLWAKRLYYTIEQVRAAYPPVPKPAAEAVVGWPEFSEDEVQRALKRLPMGIQMTLERDEGGADRSLELVRLARTLLKFKVAPDMAAVLLERSTLGRSKYGNRRDGRQRLLTTVADAMLDS